MGESALDFYRDLCHEGRADEWLAAGEYTILHRPSGISLWIANGASFLAPYHCGGPELTWWQRQRIWPTIKRLRVAIARHALTEKELSNAR